MATYRDLGINDATFIAAVDFSTCQYQFVKPGSVAGEVALANATCGPGPIGIIQNNPCPQQEAQVRVFGFSKLVATVGTCNLLWGRWLFCASNGHGEALTAVGCPFSAKYVDTASYSSGSAVVQVLLFGFSPCSAASTT